MSKGEKPDAWMPLYIGDWDGDTMHLTCEEDGAYGRLIRSYWRNGPPADDDAKLARIVRMELRQWRRLRSTLVLFFTVEAGVWRHKRVDMELIRWTEKRERAIERARKGGEAKAASSRKIGASSTQQALLAGCTSASSTTVDGSASQSTRSARFSNLDFRSLAVMRTSERWVCETWIRAVGSTCPLGRSSFPRPTLHGRRTSSRCSHCSSTRTASPSPPARRHERERQHGVHGRWDSSANGHPPADRQQPIVRPSPTP